MKNLMEASTQWATRPDDERFHSMQDLYNAVLARRNASTEMIVKSNQFQAYSNDDKNLLLDVGHMTAIEPTNWAFGQIASLAQAPAAYLRTLPAPLAAQCLNQSMSKRSVEEYKTLTIATDEVDVLASATGPKYGRIYDAQIVEAAQKIIDRTEGRFYNPPAYMKRAGQLVHGANGEILTEPAGLYASDRDVFMFFIDGGSIIDGGNERDQLNRGFFMWNSEVGKATFGLKAFLFRVVCGNNIVWDATEQFSLKIKHTSGAPYRFADEALPALKELTAASALPAELQIKRAKEYALPKDEEFQKFAAKFDFTKAQARKAVEYAEREEGQCATLWDFINGLTAYARDLAHTDSRIELETRAGKLLDIVKE